MASVARASAERQSAAGVLSTLVIVTLVLILASQGRKSRAELPTTPPAPSVSLAVDHTAPLSVTIVAGNRNDKSIVDLSHDGAQAVSITLPSTWKIREVRHAALIDLRSGPDENGRTIWSIPPKATVSFEAPERISSIRITNPTKVPLQIALTLLDLATGKKDETSILLKDAPATIP